MAEVRGPSVVELKWQPPQYSNGIIVTYIIFYRMDDSSPDATWKTKHENGKSMFLNNLCCVCCSGIYDIGIC